MPQLALCFEAVEARPRAVFTHETAPTCSFGNYCVSTDGKAPGYYGAHHCADCAAEVERACAAFEADVRAGKYNWRGYTPAEWNKAGHDPAAWARAERRELSA